MTITIFGATGTVGQQLVKLALVKGYNVKAFGRNVFTTDFLKHDHLELVHGALFDEGDVKDALKGSDAVISVIGGAFDGTDKSRSLGMKNIVKQMEAVGVKRIVALGGMGVLADENGKLLMDAEDYPQEYLPVGKEHLKAYEILKASSLNWTFVCSPDIHNGEATGSYHTAAEKNPAGSKGHINSGDLAMFMLNEASKNEFVQKRVGISN